MRIKGKKITGPNIEVVIVPRHSGNIIFKAQAVLNYDDLEKICPKPNPPTGMKPGGKPFQNVESPKYRDSLLSWATKRTNWMILKSLEATEGLEWETIKMSDSETWGNYADELRESGFTEQEIIRVVDGVMTANGLNQGKIDEALNDFLAGQEAQKENESSQNSGQ